MSRKTGDRLPSLHQSPAACPMPAPSRLPRGPKEFRNVARTRSRCRLVSRPEPYRFPSVRCRWNSPSRPPLRAAFWPDRLPPIDSTETSGPCPAHPMPSRWPPSPRHKTMASPLSDSRVRVLLSQPPLREKVPTIGRFLRLDFQSLEVYPDPVRTRFDRTASMPYDSPNMITLEASTTEQPLASERGHFTTIRSLGVIAHRNVLTRVRREAVWSIHLFSRCAEEIAFVSKAEWSNDVFVKVKKLY